MSDLPMPEPVSRDQPLAVQHDTDPASDHGIARRIPHLGHALLFLSLTIACIFFITLLLFLAFHRTVLHDHQQALYIGGLSQAIGYLVAIAVSFPLFPLLWHKSFLDGIDWTWRQAKLHWWKLLVLGIALSLGAQACDRLVKAPKGTDIVELFRSPLAAWITTLLGGLLAPIYEEIAFRGFLLPGFATAYDWLTLERTPAARQRWQQTVSHTRGAWIFASLVTSVLFVSIHGAQLHWSLGALSVLFLPSLVFCFVRIRYRSVAAAALVHMAYDLLIFLEIIVSTGGFRHLEKLAG